LVVHGHAHQVSKKDLNAVRIKRDDFHGELNDSISANVQIGSVTRARAP
jgi:hypothetical protein